MTAVSPLRVPVLMYHEIADTSATPSRLAVSPDVFADQLAYLRDAGFNAVTAGTLSAILADGAGHLPERPVVLTFDDGYGDFYSQALPLLKQHGFTGTAFHDYRLGRERGRREAHAQLARARRDRAGRHRDWRAYLHAPATRPAAGDH